MLKCPSCGRTGDDIGKCGSFLTCPKLEGAVEVNPTKDVIINCDGCHVTRVMEVGRIMHGRSLVADHVCQRDQDSCAAHVVDYYVDQVEALPIVKPQVSRKPTK